MTTYSQRYAAGDSNTAGAFYFDTITAVDYAATKIGYGAAGSVTWVDASNPLPINVISALPAGTNAIGKLAANSGVDIGDVDVTSIIPGTGATNLGKAIDTATGATDTGVLLLATRDDVLSAITPVDGDNAQLRVDANGALWCVMSGTTAVSGTVTANQGGTWNIGTVTTVTGVTTVSTVNNLGAITTSITPGTSPAHLGKTDDLAHSRMDTGVFVLAVRRDTAIVDTDADGDYASLNVDSTGRLWCNVSNTLTVASHAVTNAGTFAVQVDGTALTRLTDIETNTDYGATTGNGTAAGSLRVTLANDSTGIVALTTSTASIGKLASNSGVTIGAVEIAAAQTLGTVTTVTTCSTVTTLTGSGVAHDAADSGNPHKIGAKATTSLSGLTLVANGDRTDIYSGIDGVPIIRLNCNLEDIVTGYAAITDGSSTSLIAAQGAGVKVYITDVIISNSSSTDVTIDLRDGTAGSVKATFSGPKTYGGAHKTLSTPLPFSANTAVAADPSASASTVYVTLIGFKSKV